MGERAWIGLRAAALWLLALWLGLVPLGSAWARRCACHQVAPYPACCASAVNNLQPAKSTPEKPHDCDRCTFCQAGTLPSALLPAKLPLPEQELVAILPIPIEQSVAVSRSCPLFIQPLLTHSQSVPSPWAPRAPPMWVYSRICRRCMVQRRNRHLMLLACPCDGHQFNLT